MYGICDTCKKTEVKYNSQDPQDQVTWFQWEQKQHEYTKGSQKMVTKKTTKTSITGNVQDLISKFKAQIPLFKVHYFNWIEQQRQYNYKINNLDEDEILIICDFSENYTVNSVKKFKHCTLVLQRHL